MSGELLELFAFLEDPEMGVTVRALYIPSRHMPADDPSRDIWKKTVQSQWQAKCKEALKWMKSEAEGRHDCSW